MDLNQLRGLLALVGLATFIALTWWAYSPHRREHFDAVARDVLDEARAELERNANPHG
jgi:cbb3-type cytochrome oxidase subunit 3